MKQMLFLLLVMILVLPVSLADGLALTEVDVSVDYDDAYTYRLEGRRRPDSGTVFNNSRIDVDVLPGSNVTFTLRIENTFHGDSPTIREIFATITIEEIDDEEDLEERSVDFDLEAGNEDRVDVKFNIPLNVDEGTYDVKIEVEGQGKNDTSFLTRLNSKLEVKKQSHDIRITNVALIPSLVECDRKSKIEAEIMNLGSNREPQVALEFRSQNLGINSYDTDILLESSKDATDEEKMHKKTLNFAVPDFFSAGTYPIFVNLYWNNFVLFDQKIVELHLKDCPSSIVKKSEGKPEETAEEVVVITPEEEKSSLNITAITGAPVFTTTELNFDEDQNLFLILLSTSVLVLFFAAAAVIVFFGAKIRDY